MRKDKLHFNSKTIHGGQQPDKGYRAVMPPVYLTSTYAQSSPGDHQGYEYSRTHNPTRTALEASLASIENGKHGFCFGSGMAAIDAVVKLLSPGDEVISTNDLYGGVIAFTKIFQPSASCFTLSICKPPTSQQKLMTNQVDLGSKHVPIQ